MMRNFWYSGIEVIRSDVCCAANTSIKCCKCGKLVKLPEAAVKLTEHGELQFGCRVCSSNENNDIAKGELLDTRLKKIEDTIETLNRSFSTLEEWLKNPEYGHKKWAKSGPKSGPL